MMILKTLITFSLLLTFSSATNTVVDFCVADLRMPKGPSGYPCRNPTTLTAKDFVFSGLGIPSNTTNVFKSGINVAFDDTYPATNGLGLSMLRIDMEVNGVIPLHSHRVSELIIVIEGSIIAGFISSNNVPYYTTLNKGDVFAFPQGLLHFQLNVGKTRAYVLACFASANPGIQVMQASVFGNALPTELVQKVSSIDRKEVERLKKIFNGF